MSTKRLSKNFYEALDRERTRLEKVKSLKKAIEELENESEKAYILEQLERVDTKKINYKNLTVTRVEQTEKTVAKLNELKEFSQELYNKFTEVKEVKAYVKFNLMKE